MRMRSWKSNEEIFCRGGGEEKEKEKRCALRY